MFGRGAHGRVDEVLTIWQEIRVAMRDLLARPVELGELHWNASGCPDPKQRSICSRSEHNHTVAIPRAAVTPLRIAQGLWRGAEDIHLLQLAAGKEAEEPAVRGPERVGRSFAAVHGLRSQTVERTEPNDGLALVRCDERAHILAVRRDRQVKWAWSRRRRDVDANPGRLRRCLSVERHGSEREA